MVAKAQKKEEALATQEEPRALTIPMLSNEDMVQDAGGGFEQVGAGDLALPFLVILQSGSPQLKRGEQKIDGAVEGDIFNTVTGEYWSGIEGIFAIPCTYKKAYVEWKPRENGGGFVAQHESDSIMKESTKNEQGRDLLSNGNVIVPTAYHYILVVDPVSGSYNEGVVAMTSTQLKKSRKWNSIMASLKLSKKDGTKFTPPMYSHIYKLLTEPEKNEMGTWSGWKVEVYSQVPSMELYSAARKFATDVAKGALREAAPPQATEAVDEKVPF